MWRALVLLMVALLAFASSAAPLRDDENVVFFPGLGWKSGRNLWSLEVRGWVFENERRPGARRLLMKLLGIDPATLTAEEIERFDRRSKLFLIDAERDKDVPISFGGRTHIAPSLSDGYFAGTMLFEDSVVQKLATPDGRQVSFTLQRRKTNVVSGVVQLMAEEGLSVISDIDDTIKISNVRDREKLLRNTFLATFKAVPGMADLYQEWATNDHAAFHYVSASPYQLFLPLSEFVSEGGFPAGSFHLRSFNLKNGIAQIMDGPQSYKLTTIEPLLARFPKRSFILVGDSGEFDPEIYAELARKFPGQVRKIYIRDVTGEASNAERYGKAFAGVPGEKWQIFTDATELRSEKTVIAR